MNYSYFDPTLKICLFLAMSTHVPDEPGIVKSRPIEGDNACSVLLKLNKVRHYVFVKDSKAFATKKKFTGRAFRC